LLKALCGGSNIDIDQQNDRRSRDSRPWSSSGGGGGSAGTSPVSKRKEHDSNQSGGSVLASTFSQYLGGLNPQQVILAAVALFVALMYGLQSNLFLRLLYDETYPVLQIHVQVAARIIL
jgi:hypothetical protein